MDRKPSVFTDSFIIESIEGKRIKINPVYSYPPPNPIEEFYGQIVDVAAELDECGIFIDSGFKPSEFFKKLKEKGYKVYWLPEKQVGESK